MVHAFLEAVLISMVSDHLGLMSMYYMNVHGLCDLLKYYDSMVYAAAEGHVDVCDLCCCKGP